MSGSMLGFVDHVAGLVLGHADFSVGIDAGASASFFVGKAELTESLFALPVKGIGGGFGELLALDSEFVLV